ncbi:MAG: hypothetical protein ACXVA2_13745 [Mucilaginibacter sp.]
MRKLLKVLLPPSIGFAVYFIAIRYSSVYFSLRIDEMGEGTVESFMAYFRYFMPLLFTVAVLTQLLIIAPVWDKVFLKSKKGRFTSLFVLFFICLLFAAGISYAIWDEPQSGVKHLIKVCIFMISIQLVYWVVNLLVLYFLTKKAQQLPEDMEASE